MRARLARLDAENEKDACEQAEAEAEEVPEFPPADWPESEGLKRDSASDSARERKLPCSEGGRLGRPRLGKPCSEVGREGGREELLGVRMRPPSKDGWKAKDAVGVLEVGVEVRCVGR